MFTVIFQKVENFTTNEFCNVTVLKTSQFSFNNVGFFSDLLRDMGVQTFALRSKYTHQTFYNANPCMNTGLWRAEDLKEIKHHYKVIGLNICLSHSKGGTNLQTDNIWVFFCN